MNKVRGLGVSAIFTACLATGSANATMLISIDGHVQVSTGEGFKPATGPMELREGDTIIVANGATAQLLYPDGCRYAPIAGQPIMVGSRSPCAAQSAQPAPNGAGISDIKTAGIRKKNLNKRVVQRHLYRQTKAAQEAIARQKNAIQATVSTPGQSQPMQQTQPIQAMQPIAPVQVVQPVQTVVAAPMPVAAPASGLFAGGGMTTALLVGGAVAGVTGIIVLNYAAKNERPSSP